MISGIHHVGIATGDIERSKRFYCGLLGMATLREGQIEKNASYDLIFDLKDAKAKAALLQLGNMRIELWEFQHARGIEPEPRQPVFNPRINHICFQVSDVQSEYERLSAAGVTFHSPPQKFGVAKAVYGRDPDGNIFELAQWPPQRSGQDDEPSQR